MKRRDLFKQTGLLTSMLALQGLGFSSRSWSAQASSTILSYSGSFTTPGRIGFYKDYSELKSTGVHRFYVYRTHGSEGTVSVSFKSEGDAHTQVEGTLTWGDRDISVKAIDVAVPSKALTGEHRIVVNMSSPTNGVQLHFGSQTVAYGVIDDGTVASDDRAVFFDTGASTNGSGKASDPFDNIYDAIKASSGKRFIYGRGNVVVDGTNMVGPYGDKCKGINAPATRAGESSRLIICAWPEVDNPEGNLIISGGTSTNSFGFCAKNDESYHTYKNITFQDLDSSSIEYGPCSGIWYHYGESAGLTVEQCTFKNIKGADGTNTAGVSPYGVHGAKIWRCLFNGISINTTGSQQNSAGVLTYDGDCVSVQRCDFSNMGKGVYHKRAKIGGIASTSCKFNVFRGVAAYYGNSGSSNPGHSNTIVQSNLFIGNGTSTQDGIYHSTENKDELGGKHWWCNNVFHGCGYGENAAITFRLAHQAMIFNNIFYNCRRAWREFMDYTDSGCVIEFADYNQVDLGESSQLPYELAGKDFSKDTLVSAIEQSIAKLGDSTSIAIPDVYVQKFSVNDSYLDPKFRNIDEYDFSVAVTSPAFNSGLDGKPKGYILLGETVDVIGLKELVPVDVPSGAGGQGADEKSRPKKPRPIEVTSEAKQ